MCLGCRFVKESFLSRSNEAAPHPLCLSSLQGSIANTMITKIEAVGIFACIALMVIALFLLRVEETTQSIAALNGLSQSASVVTIADGQDAQTRAQLVAEATAEKSLIVDDITIGNGLEATMGDTVQVHYIGRLQNGQEFDNSHKRGTPISFTLGEGEVIAGWEEGIVGMKVGGERILVVPPEYGYGNRAVGPIPAGSTLVFAVELMNVE